MLMEKAKGIGVGRKGRRLQNESGWGGAGGRAQRLPPQCVPRKKYEERSTYEPKSLMLMEKAKGLGVGSKGHRVRNKSGWGGAGGSAQRLPPQCVPRKKRIGTQIIDADGKSKRNRSR